MPSRQFCTFMLAEWFFGIDILQVQEIIRTQPLTRIPLAPTMIHGLINLRGQIVTAVDMRGRLGLPPRNGGKPPINVVVRTDEGASSLQVDEIRDMIEVDDATSEPVPETVQGTARDLITNVYKLEKRLLLVLDVHKTLSLDPALFLA